MQAVGVCLVAMSSQVLNAALCVRLLEVAEDKTRNEVFKLGLNGDLCEKADMSIITCYWLEIYGPPANDKKTKFQ